MAAAMTCDTCPRDKKHQLFEGGMACSYCEQWRHECEARAILAMPGLQSRRNFLYGYTKPNGQRFQGVKGTRGDAEVKRLERTMMRLWKQRRNEAA